MHECVTKKVCNDIVTFCFNFCQMISAKTCLGLCTAKECVITVLSCLGSCGRLEINLIVIGCEAENKTPGYYSANMQIDD